LGFIKGLSFTGLIHVLLLIISSDFSFKYVGDEINLTDATVPPTSKYKVFYHVYAGKNIGTYFKVYLKGDGLPVRDVAGGYIKRDAYADETLDFIAPSGYREMCILVGKQEECGFKQVSTSFAVNYVTDKYLQSQATEQDITTEKECISGTPSAFTLLNPNLQSGVEETLDPDLYNRGIVRVCATEQPGKSTDKTRWAEVGICGDENMRCWLDTLSVKDAIRGTGIETATLEEL